MCACVCASQPHGADTYAETSSPATWGYRHIARSVYTGLQWSDQHNNCELVVLYNGFAHPRFMARKSTQNFTGYLYWDTLGRRHNGTWRTHEVLAFLKASLSPGESCCCFKPVDRSFVRWLLNTQHASVSQGWICSDNFTCCHNEIEITDTILYPTQSQFTDTGPTILSADLIKPGACQGSHWVASY